MGDQDHLSYAKVVQLGEGRRVFLRFLNQGDREGFAELVREAVPEEAILLKQDFRDRKTLNNWFDRLHYRLVLPLVAVDLDRHRFAAVAILHRGEQAFQHIGDIRMLVAEPYCRLGLGSLMLGDLIDLAREENLFWLSAAVPWDQNQVISAFEARGFEIKTRLPDYLRRPNGETQDMVLLMRYLKKREAEF
jgi:L-amino acid N-acyltransferase YncA